MAPIFVKGFSSSQGPFLDSQHEVDVVLIFGEDFSSFQRSMLDFNDCHGRVGHTAFTLRQDCICERLST